MPGPAVALIGAATAIGGGIAQSSASSKATKAQVTAQDKAIAEQRRQFEEYQRLVKPYVDAGEPALKGLLDLTGLSKSSVDYGAYVRNNPDLLAQYNAQSSQQGNVGFGSMNDVGFGSTRGFGVIDNFVGEGQFDPGLASAPPAMSIEEFGRNHYETVGKQEGRDIAAFTNDPQAAAVGALENSSIFRTLARQGEDAILQNASATGGIRGGNTQGALARFRPQLLDQFIERQYGRLGGIAQMGATAAAGAGQAGINTGQNIANNLVGQGNAQAQGSIAQGNIFANTLGTLGGVLAGGIGPSNQVLNRVRVAF